MPWDKDEIVKAKLARRSDTDQRPVRPRSKKDRPIVAECKTLPKPWHGKFHKLFGWYEWRAFGKYRTREIADTAIEADKRKYPDSYEYRIKGEAMQSNKEKLNEYMNSLPCAACEHSNHPNSPLTDDACQCMKCGHVMSGSHLHSCKTGWKNRVCEGCNESDKEEV